MTDWARIDLALPLLVLIILQGGERYPNWDISSYPGLGCYIDDRKAPDYIIFQITQLLKPDLGMSGFNISPLGCAMKQAAW